MRLSRIEGTKFHLFIWIAAGLFFLLGCSEGDTGNTKKSASIDLTLRCARSFEESSPSLSPAAAAPNICDDNGISKIGIAIYRSDTKEYVLSDLKIWDCDAHTSGKLSVPSETSLYLELTGYDHYNEPCWFTTIRDLWIEPNTDRYILIGELIYQCDDDTPPEISYQYPAPEADDVGLGESIIVVFNEKLAPSTVNDQVITLSDGSNLIAGDIRYVKETHTILFNPHSSFAPATTYTVTLDNGEGDINDTAMNPFGQTLTWQFRTHEGIYPPRVVATQPIADAVDVPCTTTIDVTFSKPIDFSSIDAAQFSVAGSEGLTSGNLAYNTETFTVSFEPDTNLAYSSLYTATLSEQIADLDGFILGAEYQWQFTTQAIPPPVLLSAPENLAIIEASTLTWDPVEPAPFGYCIYARTEGEPYDYGNPVWEVYDPSITQADIEGFGLPAGATYFFVVHSIGSNGGHSLDSEEVYLAL